MDKKKAFRFGRPLFLLYQRLSVSRRRPKRFLLLSAKDQEHANNDDAKGRVKIHIFIYELMGFFIHDAAQVVKQNACAAMDR